jgi:hypothetical protein
MGGLQRFEAASGEIVVELFDGETEFCLLTGHMEL